MEPKYYIHIPTASGDVCLPRITSEIQKVEVKASASGVGRCIFGLLCAIVSVIISFVSFALATIQYVSVLPEVYQSAADSFVKLLQDGGFSVSMALTNYEYVIVYLCALILGLACLVIGLFEVFSFGKNLRRGKRTIAALVLGIFCILFAVASAFYLGKAILVFCFATGLVPM